MAMPPSRPNLSVCTRRCCIHEASMRRRAFALEPERLCEAAHQIALNPG
jgi:hypothetical protein